MVGADRVFPWRGALLVALAGCAAAWTVSPFRLVFVTGNSMAPTLGSGSIRVLDREHFRRHPIAPGDVVVFDLHGTTYVKRVAAVGGDRVPLVRWQRSLGYEVVRPFQMAKLQRLLQRERWSRTAQLVEQDVPEGHLFVLGDNPGESLDSRSFGPVPATTVRGRLLFVPAPEPELVHVAMARSRR